MSNPDFERLNGILPFNQFKPYEKKQRSKSGLI